MPPDATPVGQFLRRARDRLLMIRAVEGAAAGCALAAVGSLGGMSAQGALIVVVVAALTRMAFGKPWRWGWWRDLPAIAMRVERHTNEAHNLLVTAAELPRDAVGYATEAVRTRAAAIARRLDATALFPARKAALVLLLAAAALVAARSRPAGMARLIDRRLPGTTVATVDRLTITVVPPSYTGLPPATFVNPAEVQALAGSRIEVRVEARAASVNLETLIGVEALRLTNDAFIGSAMAMTPGFLALEPRDSAGNPGSRRLVGLLVANDRPPRVALNAPGRDLFFSAVPGSIDVAVSADDDLALESLQLRYTAVSGSGERFSFVEREVPLTLTRSNPRSWAGRGSWALEQMQLEPGDLLVYRAVARDRRPGAPPVESESYVIEVVTPGAIAAEGFAADDQRDRYAASQQMVILKTERLLARRNALTADSVATEARLIAAEQRQVRAEFVFMMGGEVEDEAGEAAGTLELNETAEAEAEGDILAGRLQNRGRIEMTRAIRAMSRASSALIDVSLDQALRDERVALDNLMRAFSRSRFILRALTQRERIDLERRLTGSLVLTSGLSLPTAEPQASERTVSLRRLLAALASLSANDTSGRRANAAAAAVDAMRTDPASSAMRQLASDVQRLVASVPDPVRVDSLVRQVSALIGSGTPRAPGASPGIQADRIAGALRDAARRGTPRP